MIKLLAGPMATLSHQGLRKIIEDFGGCDEYYTEMINAATFLTHGQFEHYYILNEIAKDKIVWQLTGKDCVPMAKAAKELCSLGGIGIDLNMGCSAPEIYRSGAGIAWMTKPIDETKRLVCEVRNAIDSFNQSCVEGSGSVESSKNGANGENVVGDECGSSINCAEKVKSGAHKKQRLSVKLRLGDEDFTDDGFYKFCEMLYQNGVEQLVLHPRTKKEKLARPPRYNYVEDLAIHFKDKIPVILNGNVRDFETFNFALQKAPSASGIMIARMSCQKPWIFAELKKRFNQNQLNENDNLENLKNDKKLKIDRLQIGLEYINNLRLYQPKEFFETRMQRFFAYYCDNFSYAHYIKSKMLNCKNLEDAEITFKSYFDEVPQDRFIEI